MGSNITEELDRPLLLLLLDHLVLEGQVLELLLLLLLQQLQVPQLLGGQGEHEQQEDRYGEEKNRLTKKRIRPKDRPAS